AVQVVTAGPAVQLVVAAAADDVVVAPAAQHHFHAALDVVRLGQAVVRDVVEADVHAAAAQLVVRDVAPRAAVGDVHAIGGGAELQDVVARAAVQTIDVEVAVAGGTAAEIVRPAVAVDQVRLHAAGQ